MIASLLTLALLSGRPLQTVPPAGYPELAPERFDRFKAVVEEQVGSTFHDPEAVRWRWTAPPSFANYRHYGHGWIGCLRFNAKNLYGAYVGERYMKVMTDPDMRKVYLSFDYPINSMGGDECRKAGY